MPETDAEQKAVMQAWTDWFGKLGGALVDGGNPVSQTRTIASERHGERRRRRTTRPATAIIKADDLDTAVALAKGCPVLAGGASVEVAETFEAM